jgi:hypothetical protein
MMSSAAEMLAGHEGTLAKPSYSLKKISNLCKLVKERETEI